MKPYEKLKMSSWWYKLWYNPEMTSVEIGSSFLRTTALSPAFSTPHRAANILDFYNRLIN